MRELLMFGVIVLFLSTLMEVRKTQKMIRENGDNRFEVIEAKQETKANDKTQYMHIGYDVKKGQPIFQCTVKEPKR